MNQTVTTTVDSPQTLPAVVPATPMELLASAIDRGMPPEMIEKLMALQERYEANLARKAFDNAMASAKAEIPVIIKNRTVDFTSQKGRTHYKHEDLAEVVRTIVPILSKYGLSHRFKSKAPPNEPITVTCRISHRDGYFEENELPGPRDDTGNKNSLQAIGSTLTYLQRMTLKLALGLAASEDDDGKASEAIEYITEEQVATLTKMIVDTGGNIAKFCEFAQVETLGNIYAPRYEAAVEAVKRAAAQRQQAAKQETVVDPEKQSDGEWPGPISKDQVETIRTLIINTKSDAKKFCIFMGVKNVEEIAGKDFDRAVKAFDKNRGARK